MESLNRMAIELVDEALDFADELNVDAYQLENDATVLDFGVDARGGIEAGLLLTEIQTAGLATVSSGVRRVAGAPRTVVEFATDHPALAVLCSQKAGWELSDEDFEGLGSGPARALVGEEAEYEAVGYHDAFDLTVLAVETADHPTPGVAEQVAAKTGVQTSGVFLPVFRTGSMVGSVTVASRAAELAVFRLFELDYDPLAIESVAATAPVAPVSTDEPRALGRTNDALAYGGQVHVTVSEGFDRFDEVASSAAQVHNAPFYEIFEEVDWEFSDLDAGVFAPAEVTVDVLGGGTETHGGVDEALLAESFES